MHTYNNTNNYYSDDENRVSLKAISKKDDCQNDYINASYIDVSLKVTGSMALIDVF